jgi:Mlc titration factor MtfA (ptsG expression regulator)
VVIHEFAHKLDMLNGAADGFPPLHRGMAATVWSTVFSEAYRDFRSKVEAGTDSDIDPYAAENPGEFFAVLSETFFERPMLLGEAYPSVYGQLAAFYRQNPAGRMADD